MTDVEVGRNLQSILHLLDFSGVKGLLIGRFQKFSEMSVEKVKRIVSAKRELNSLPVIYGADFGHTDPYYITFPIGGSAELESSPAGATIKIVSH